VNPVLRDARDGTSAGDEAAGPGTRDLEVVDLGVRRYADVLELQRDLARRRISGALAQDVLLLVEHPHVVTLGRSSKDAHLVASRELLAARGIDLFEVERGGDVTYHGPGQLVGYPIFDLKRHRQDLHWYLRQVEEALIRALALFGLAGVRSLGYTGVWVEAQGAIQGTPHARKIASIGVHARDWVTWHGFALNVTTDLSYFDLMVPCGIPDVRMTSVCTELGASAPGMAQMRAAVVSAFGDVFDLTPRDVELSTVEAAPGEAMPKSAGLERDPMP
jgi:lipoyl(octanoyl) transferase